MGSTTVNVTSQNTYPIRIFCEGIHKGNGSGYYSKGFTLDSDIPSEIVTAALSNTFNVVQEPYINRVLYDALNRAKTKYMSHRTKNPHFEELYNNHFQALVRILKAHPSNEDIWYQYIDIETKTLHQAAVDELPELSTSDYVEDVQACSIQAQTNGSSSLIRLLVNPRQLFNALAIAENTGAVLEYKAPKEASKKGTLGLFRPHPIAPHKENGKGKGLSLK
jgi:hypothetical protein